MLRKFSVFIFVLALLVGCKKKKKSPQPQANSPKRMLAKKRAIAKKRTIAKKRAIAKKPSLPTKGKVVGFEMGDLACYIKVVDDKGKTHHLNGVHSLCPKDKKSWRNKRVALSYKKLRMLNCPVDMKCKPKSKIVQMVAKMTLLSK